MLIVARDEDLGKWVAAFSGKPYYRGDFDACPNFAEYDYDAAEPLNVYVCSDECMRRNWDAFFAINSDPNQTSRPRFAIVVDAGAGNAHTIMPLISLDLNRLAGSAATWCRSRCRRRGCPVPLTVRGRASTSWRLSFACTG